jgi:hypothetical protein
MLFKVLGRLHPGPAWRRRCLGPGGCDDRPGPIDVDGHLLRSVARAGSLYAASHAKVISSALLNFLFHGPDAMFYKGFMFNVYSILFLKFKRKVHRNYRNDTTESF